MKRTKGKRTMKREDKQCKAGGERWRGNGPIHDDASYKYDNPSIDRSAARKKKDKKQHEATADRDISR